MQQVNNVLAARIDEALRGYRQVKAYGQEGFEVSRIEREIELARKTSRRAWRNRAGIQAVMEALIGMLVGAMVLYGGLQILHGTGSPGAFFSFLLAVIMTYQPLKSLATVKVAVQEGVAAGERLLSIIELRPRILDRARSPTIAGGARRDPFSGCRILVWRRGAGSVAY